MAISGNISTEARLGEGGFVSVEWFCVCSIAGGGLACSVCLLVFASHRKREFGRILKNLCETSNYGYGHGLGLVLIGGW